MRFGQGLRRLESEDDVRQMLRDGGRSRVVEVYNVRAVQSHALPLVPNERISTTVDEQATSESEAFFEGCYAPVIEEHNEDDPESAENESNPDGPAVEDRYDGHISVEEEEVGVETHDEEERAVEDGGLLVESDYEMEEEHEGTTEDDNRTINFDFEFGTTDGQQPRDSDTEYGDFDEL
ncbi:hypothetical protein Adt_18125 [Abeliophyllum distichum]|uniref:Uncharacterized protein n=1 Tax=Abeliophyllum distichum TaxID=126358 RepID=A0ABD1TJ89_9LAMI